MPEQWLNTTPPADTVPSAELCPPQGTLGPRNAPPVPPSLWDRGGKSTPSGLAAEAGRHRDVGNGDLGGGKVRDPLGSDCFVNGDELGSLRGSWKEKEVP